MDRGIFVALSGAVLQEKRLELLSDNLANVNTAGFKKQKEIFENAMPAPYGPRTFAVLNSTVTDMTQGVAERTERKLDVAIKGDGFFVVNTPNGARYTRDGSFTMGREGTLLTREGYEVLGEKGPVKLASPNVVIDGNGNIEVDGAPVDRLKLVNFSNPGAMYREGNFFAPQAGDKQVEVDGKTQIEQGYIEVSNVNPVKALTTMIEVMRSYETHSKMIQAIDDMTKKSIEEVGRG